MSIDVVGREIQNRGIFRRSFIRCNVMPTAFRVLGIQFTRVYTRAYRDIKPNGFSLVCRSIASSKMHKFIQVT
jgi:hypothetical protein